MSCTRKERVYRAPLKRCGIVDNSHTPPRGAVGIDFDEDCVLDFGELREEYSELFGWSEGDFRPALCPGGYLDFVIYSRPSDDWGYSEFNDVGADVFRRIIPDVNLDDVHYCEYEWYDGVDAPERY